VVVIEHLIVMNVEKSMLEKTIKKYKNLKIKGFGNDK
tara:strand:- start:319 stop:429 length:111 start_codon:yes stop_codon:yes gene_type:complete